MKCYEGNPLPLGCTVNGERVNFSIDAAMEKTCELLLYKKGEDTPCECFTMKADPLLGNVRHLAVELKKPEMYEYAYQIEDQYMVDPYGKSLGKERVGIISDEFDWEGDKPLQLPYQDIIAYSLHVRGYTKHASSKVRHKGTFQGLLEKIPYLKELGVNQIQCMPVYEVIETPSYTNYWGYGAGYFFAPKSSYAQTENGVTELKNLVKCLHKQGMELVLEMPFTEDTAKTMIIDCLRYYAAQFHIDGFIIHPQVTPIEMVSSDPLLAGVKILRKQELFQTAMRRFLKGDEGIVPDVMWWLKHQSKAEGIFNYVASHNGFTLADVFSYDGKHNEANGENNHDGPEYNYSWNCGAEGPSRKKLVVELRKKQMRNAFFLLLLAQGTPCILAGDEFANSQKGNNNVYCQDNETAWTDWSRLGKEKELQTFVKELIAFRKQHKVLHPDREMQGIDYTSCGIPDISFHGESAWQAPSDIASRQLGVFLHGQDKEEDLFVAYNMHWISHVFALPTLPSEKKWYLAATTEDGVLKEQIELKDKKEIELEERTIKVFVGK